MIRRTVVFVALLGLARPVWADVDGDGFEPITDCNDTDPNIYPGAPIVLGGENCGAGGAVVIPTGSGGMTGGMSGGPGGPGGAGGTPVEAFETCNPDVAGTANGAGNYPLDCGPLGVAVERHGPPSNRVNYAIIGDGYLAADLVPGGTFDQHIAAAMARRFTPVIGQPYGRYRKFVNICAIKLESPGPICGSSTFGCCGNDSSRLASCNMFLVNQAFSAHLPASFQIDWRAVVLASTSWWNAGSITMLWSGGNQYGPGAALHEGAHGFHSLADEYGFCAGAGCGMDTMGTGPVGTDFNELNLTGDPVTTGGKWDLWMGYDQTGATGRQSTWNGSRSRGTEQYRPSANSTMNSLFGCNPNVSFNAVSREQMIFSIWAIVDPIDSVTPPPGTVTGTPDLHLDVIDPEVISVDWYVDAIPVAINGGTTFSTAGLATGSHAISATAYDNAGPDWVRYRTGACPPAAGPGCRRSAWGRSVHTINWAVTSP